MQIVRCKNCGAQLDISKAIGGVIACEYCNSKHTLAKSKDEQAINFLAIAEHELDNGKFDEAFSAYSKAASIDKAEPEAYYGMALASYKVRYIKDVNNNRLQPIIYDATNKSFEKDSNYIKALNLATPEQKEEYTKRAKEIDYIRNEFYKLKQEGKEYDVFICVKVTDDTTKRKTIDSERANDIYYHLKDKGYKPFYSEREIQNETGVDYEARILYALYSSPCMIVICSDESYLQTPWVKNEYSRFISLINDEQKESNSIAIGFFDKPIERLPNRNGRLQGVCLKNPDAYSKIVDFVDNCSPAAKLKKKQAEDDRKAQEEQLKRQIEEQAELQAKQLEEFKRQQAQAQKELQDRLAALQKDNTTQQRQESSGGNASVQSLLTRANQFLENSDFYNAETYYNRVLDIDPTNSAAWLNSFMVEVRAKSPNELKTKIREYIKKSTDVTNLKNSLIYLNAKKYATNYINLFEEIEEILNSIYSDLSQKEKIARDKAEKERIAFEREESFCHYEAKDIYEKNTLSVFEVRNNCLVSKPKVWKMTLGTIIIPNYVTSIADFAFDDLSDVKEIFIPNSVTSIGRGAFRGCSGLEHLMVQSKNRKFYDVDDCLIEAATKTLVLGCKNSVIPADGSVTHIRDYAFYNCEGLTSLTIPDCVAQIGESVFYNCKSLTNISVKSGNSKYHSAGNCLIETAAKKLILGCQNSTIPADGSVTHIGDNAFSGCCGITSIIIPNSVTSIGKNAFFGCKDLTSLVIPDSVTSICDNAFHNCCEIKNVTMPKQFKKDLFRLFGDKYQKGDHKQFMKQIKFKFIK